MKHVRIPCFDKSSSEKQFSGASAERDVVGVVEKAGAVHA